MPLHPQAEPPDDAGLEEAVEHEVTELMKAVSHAYVRGRFQSYTG